MKNANISITTTDKCHINIAGNSIERCIFLLTGLPKLVSGIDLIADQIEYISIEDNSDCDIEICSECGQFLDDYIACSNAKMRTKCDSFCTECGGCLDPDKEFCRQSSTEYHSSEK